MNAAKDRGFTEPLPDREKRRTAEGYMTVYLVMTLAAMLTLYLVLIGGARLGAARMQMESVSRIAQNAALAEFHREMHSRYDLFFTDTSYGGPGGGNEILAQHLRNYMDSNCARESSLPFGGVRDWTFMKVKDVQVTEARYACDDAGKAVREQVYAYMSADPAGAVISGMLVTADQWRGLEISGREWKSQTEESQEELRQALRDGRENQRKENEEKEENEEEVSAEEYEAASENPSEAENMVDQMESFQFLPALNRKAIQRVKIEICRYFNVFQPVIFLCLELLSLNITGIFNGNFDRSNHIGTIICSTWNNFQKLRKAQLRTGNKLVQMLGFR